MHILTSGIQYCPASSKTRQLEAVSWGCLNLDETRIEFRLTLVEANRRIQAAAIHL